MATNKELSNSQRKASFVPIFTTSSRKTNPRSRRYGGLQSTRKAKWNARPRWRRSGTVSAMSSKTSVSKSSFDADEYLPIKHTVPTLTERLQYIKRNVHRCVILAALIIIIIAAITATILMVLARTRDEPDIIHRKTAADHDSNQALTDPITVLTSNTTTTSSSTIVLTSAPAVLDFAKLCINEYGPCWFYSPIILGNCSFISCYASIIDIKHDHVSGNKYQLQFTAMTPKPIHSFNLNGQLCYKQQQEVGRCRRTNETMMCVSIDNIEVPKSLMLQRQGIWKSYQSNDSDACLSFQSDNRGTQIIANERLPWNSYKFCYAANISSGTYCTSPFKILMRYCAAPTPNEGAEVCFDEKSTVIRQSSRYPIQLERCPDPCPFYERIINTVIDCTIEPITRSFCDLTVMTPGTSFNSNDFTACCLDFFPTGRNTGIVNRRMGRCLHGLCIEVVDS